MRILILTLYFTPDLGSNAVIVTDLAQELERLGHKVTVITAFPHYAKNVFDQSYRGKLITKELFGNIRIIRTFLFTSLQKNRFLVRLLNYVSFNILSTLAGIFTDPQDLIIAPSPPLTIGLSAMVIGAVRRIPYIYNVQDINPDVLIKLGILKNRAFIKIAKIIEKHVYRKAKKITVISLGFQQNLLNKGVPAEKVLIIPNFIDPFFIKPGPKENSFSRQYNLINKFVILYAGNLGHSQNLEDLLECALLMKGDRQLEFVIVGNGSRKPLLQQLHKKLDLHNLQFIPFQPHARIPEIYASSDVSIVTLKKEIALDSVPSKLYTIMASSRPVIAAVDGGSDAWNLVKEADCGICIKPERPHEFMKAITTLKNNPSICRQFGEKGREFVLIHNTRNVVGKMYHNIANQILNSNE